MFVLPIHEPFQLFSLEKLSFGVSVLCCCIAECGHLLVVVCQEFRLQPRLKSTYLGAIFALTSVGFAYACRQEGPACMLCNAVSLPCLHWWLNLEARRNHSIRAPHVEDVVVVTLCSSVQASVCALLPADKGNATVMIRRDDYEPR